MTCSTPYGITAEVTGGGQRHRDGGGVLNALRHHGGGHAAHTRALRALLAVLNALRHHGGGHH